MKNATKWQVNSAQWQRLGYFKSRKASALKAQVRKKLKTFII